jgi:hypothetical protein
MGEGGKHLQEVEIWKKEMDKGKKKEAMDPIMMEED